MRRHLSCLTIGFPKVHFSTTTPIFSLSLPWIAFRGLPILGITLPINPFQFLWAFCIAISGPIFGTDFIPCMLWHSAVFFHFNKVKCTIESTRQCISINIKSKLFVKKFEHEVLITSLIEKISPRSNNSALATFGNKSYLKLGIGGNNIINWFILLCADALNSTIFRTCLWTRAYRSVPVISIKAELLNVIDFMCSPPVGVDCDA